MSTIVTPAIVVLGYERPAALQRLLNSLQRGFYPTDAEVTLIISLDRSDRSQGDETLAVAKAVDWRYGPLQVIQQPTHLGVVGHFRAAGEFTQEYGSIVLLEDDLSVAPPFYKYAQAVLEAYADDERVAGCCLYGLWFNGFTLEPFTPIDDGGDAFFLGVPHTQGLCFSARQWSNFATWWRDGRVVPHRSMHPAFLGFGPDEWFPNLAAYLAQTGRYFCFPRVSLTTGWGDAGAHFEQRTSWFQAPLQLGRRPYILRALDESDAVYDGFYELLPDRLSRLAPGLPVDDFDVDLNAAKSPHTMSSPYILTTRPALDAVEQFGLDMVPPELNVIERVPGSVLSLAKREDVRWDTRAGREARRVMHDFAWRRYRPSLRREMRAAVTRRIESVRRMVGRS